MMFMLHKGIRTYRQLSVDAERKTEDSQVDSKQELLKSNRQLPLTRDLQFSFGDRKRHVFEIQRTGDDKSILI